MTRIVLDDTSIHVPDWVVDHAAFRRWLCTGDFPEKACISFLNGEVCVDLSKEQLFSHNQVRAEFGRVIGTLIEDGQLGRFFPYGAFLANPEVGFSCQPDGVLVSYASFNNGRVRPTGKTNGDYLELEGSPDMVFEVVSDSSVEKDTATLRDLYWQAAIKEYWLADAREGKLEFDILRHTAKGYTPTRKQGGWLKSAVFGKSFRLTQEHDEFGDPLYTLAVR